MTHWVGDARRILAVKRWFEKSSRVSVLLYSGLVIAIVPFLPIAMSLRLALVALAGAIGVLYGIVRARAERSIEHELEVSRERFRTFFDQNPNAVASMDEDGNFTAVNPGYEQISGYRAAELIGKHFTMLVPPQRRPLSNDRLQQLLNGPANYEAVLLRKDGSEIPIQTDASPIRYDGNRRGIIVTTRDLTNERAMTQRLAEKDERVHGLYMIVSSAREAKMLIDEVLDFGMRALGTRYGFVTHVAEGMFTVMHRQGPGDTLPVGANEPIVASVGARLASNAHAIAIEDLTVEPYASELRLRGLPWQSYIGSRIVVEGVPYGALIFLDDHVRETPFEAADLDFVNLMSVLIGAAVAREIRHKQLEDLAFHDGLTGAANRRVLENHVRGAISYAKRAGGHVALHYIDLDGFKPINDRYGHAAGDEVLCEVARRLSSVLREHDLLARVGGDEFVAVQTASDATAVNAMKKRFAETLRRPIALTHGAMVLIGASFGVATYPEHGQTLEELLEVSDASMMREKQEHRVARV